MGHGLWCMGQGLYQYQGRVAVGGRGIGGYFLGMGEGLLLHIGIENSVQLFTKEVNAFITF